MSVFAEAVARTGPVHRHADGGRRPRLNFEAPCAHQGRAHGPERGAWVGHASRRQLIHLQPFAGLGNYLCDEILFQARLHPEHPSPLLDEAQLTTLVDMVRYVVVEAVKAKGREENFPVGWLFSRRWGKGKGGDNIILVCPFLEGRRRA